MGIIAVYFKGRGVGAKLIPTTTLKLKVKQISIFNILFSARRTFYNRVYSIKIFDNSFSTLPSLPKKYREKTLTSLALSVPFLDIRAKLWPPIWLTFISQPLWNYVAELSASWQLCCTCPHEEVREPTKHRILLHNATNKKAYFIVLFLQFCSSLYCLLLSPKETVPRSKNIQIVLIFCPRLHGICLNLALILRLIPFPNAIYLFYCNG